jgi:hypothetical protein
VVEAQAPYTIGCGCYSEGVNDDVNKYVWSTLHWGGDVEGPLKDASSQLVLDRMLVDYASVLMGMPRQAEKIGSIIKLLEENWKGDPVPVDEAVDRLADTWEWQKTILPYHRRHNWRLSMLLFRLYFDTLLISRLRQERALMRDIFRACKEHGVERAGVALLRENLLSKPYYEPPIASSSFAEHGALAGSLQDGFNIMSLHPGSTITHLYGQLMVMAASTYQQIGYQTSIGLGGQHRQRGAYLDLVWAPLSDVQYISKALLAQPSAEESATTENARRSSLTEQEASDLTTDLTRRLGWATSGSVDGEKLLWYASFGDETSCGLDGCDKPIQPIPVCEVHLTALYRAVKEYRAVRDTVRGEIPCARRSSHASTIPCPTYCHLAIRARRRCVAGASTVPAGQARRGPGVLRTAARRVTLSSEQSAVRRVSQPVARPVGACAPRGLPSAHARARHVLQSADRADGGLKSMRAAVCASCTVGGAAVQVHGRVERQDPARAAWRQVPEGVAFVPCADLGQDLPVRFRQPSLRLFFALVFCR